MMYRLYHVCVVSVHVHVCVRVEQPFDPEYSALLHVLAACDRFLIKRSTQLRSKRILTFRAYSMW